MILLEDVCSKLENILNGIDEESPMVSPVNENYYFKVYTEGLRLKENSNRKVGKNFIPVIVGVLNGEYNPVPYMEETDYNIQVQLLYPVRFKKDFYELNTFLANTFVGKIKNYGTQKALSNISVAQYGELQEVNLRGFQKWIENTYQETIDVQETYMTMLFTIYLTTAKNLNDENGVMLGNSVKITRIEASKLFEGSITQNYTVSVGESVKYVLPLKLQSVGEITVSNISDDFDHYHTQLTSEGVEIEFSSLVEGTATLSFDYSFNGTFFVDEDPILIQRVNMGQTEPAAQQVLGSDYATGFGASASYGGEIPLIIKNNDSYRELLYYIEKERKIQTIDITITELIPFVRPIEIVRKLFLTNYTRQTTLGEFLNITLSVADKMEI